MDLEELAIAQERLHELGVTRIDPMDNQQFHRCEICGRGQLLLPDRYCLDCGSNHARHQLLESAELDLENGVINEGQYLEICEKLKSE